MEYTQSVLAVAIFSTTIDLRLRGEVAKAEKEHYSRKQ